jgi:transposase-like protein
MALVDLSMLEQRYLAVREVLDTGAAVTDVATGHGVDRRTLHRWLVRYANDGTRALAEKTANRPNRDTANTLTVRRIFIRSSRLQLVRPRSIYRAPTFAHARNGRSVAVSGRHAFRPSITHPQPVGSTRRLTPWAAGPRVLASTTQPAPACQSRDRPNCVRSGRMSPR